MPQTVEINCVYQNQGWWMSNAYVCVVQDPTIVTEPSTQVTRITENHIGSYSNVDVTAVRFDHKIIQHFPTGFEKFFPNLKGIWVERCGLKSLTQNDLRHFPNLRAVWMPHNNIEVLERDLFAFNPLVEAINFTGNPLRLIYPTIFDNLKDLVALQLGSIKRPSWSREAKNRFDLLQLVGEIRQGCNDFVYREVETLQKELEDVKKENGRLKSQSGVKWKDGNVNTALFAKALVGGIDFDGSEIVVGRALLHGNFIHAKILPAKNEAYIFSGGWEISVEIFQYIIEDEEFGKYSWKPFLADQLYEGAVMISTSYAQENEAVYVGRARHNGSMNVGKIQQSCLFIPHMGEEFRIEDFEVLVYEPIVVENH